MKRFERRRKIKRIFYSPIALIVLVAVVFVLGRGAWGAYKKSRASEEARTHAAQELEDLTERYVELQTEVMSLDTPEGVEQALRSQLQVARPGEDVVFILDEPSESQSQ